MLLRLLFLLSLTTIIHSLSSAHTSEFSGFYTPNLKYNLEVYSGAWLQSRHLFLQNLDQIKEISSLESTTTGGLMRYQHSNTRFILMSRDYFDFEIEHLSSTTNVIGDDKHLMGHLTSITKRKGMWLKKIALGIPNTPSHKPFMNQTIAIIPFSTNSASSHGNQPPDETQTLRLYFFESTFWSVYRYFPHIAVCVSNSRDADFIRSLQLPVFQIFHLENSKGIAWELPRFALLTAHEAMSSNPSWAQFQFLYFTEGDQLLHMRHQTEMARFMAATKGKFALVPHRMQTMILPKTLPTELRQYIQPPWRSTVTESAELHIENATVILGSCCDHGRWKFADCGNWWYHCPAWGIANMTSWVRIGKTGFTMPTTTEHLGRCEYSASRQACPLPQTCRHRIPHELSDVCDEMPLLN